MKTHPQQGKAERTHPNRVDSTKAFNPPVEPIPAGAEVSIPPAEMNLQEPSSIPMADEEPKPETHKAAPKKQIALFKGMCEYPLLKIIITDNPRYLDKKLVFDDPKEALERIAQWLDANLAK